MQFRFMPHHEAELLQRVGTTGLQCVQREDLCEEQ
jgi:hypothetical protein